MELAPNLSGIANQYDAILCDVWGVIRDGHALLPGAIDALRQFRQSRGPVVLISNAPRPAEDLAHQLALMGAPDDAWDAIVTSGDTTRAALRERTPGKAYFIGPENRDDVLFDGLGLIFTSLADADFAVCTGLVDDLNETPDDYAKQLSDLRTRNLDLVCANPDIVVQWGDRLIYCAGALARAYEKLGGKTIVSGKPHPPIYDLGLDALRQCGFDADKSRILAIGDGPETDLAGARAMGIDALFIAGGILGQGEASISLSLMQAALSEYGETSKWAAPALIW